MNLNFANLLEPFSIQLLARSSYFVQLSSLLIMTNCILFFFHFVLFSSRLSVADCASSFVAMNAYYLASPLKITSNNFSLLNSILKCSVLKCPLPVEPYKLLQTSNNLFLLAKSASISPLICELDLILMGEIFVVVRMFAKVDVCFFPFLNFHLKK